MILHLGFPACHSLKEKRSQLKPIIARCQREFNLSIAEVGLMDRWQESLVACAVVSNDTTYSQSVLQKTINLIENTFSSVEIISQKVEFL